MARPTWVTANDLRNASHIGEDCSRRFKKPWEHLPFCEKCKVRIRPKRGETQCSRCDPSLEPNYL